MISVRKYSAVSLSIFVMFAVIICLNHYYTKIDSEYLYLFNIVLSSKWEIGSINKLLLSVGFWNLLASSAAFAIFHETEGLRIINAFLIPIIFSLVVACLVLFLKESFIEFRLFWLLYYAGVLLCNRLSFTRLSTISDSGSARIFRFIRKDLVNSDESNPATTAVDRIIVKLIKLHIAITTLALVVAFVAYCIINKDLLYWLK